MVYQVTGNDNPGTRFAGLKSCKMPHMQAFMKNLFGTILCQEFYIPAASVLTLFSAPVTILAAPGSGVATIFEGMYIAYNYNSAAYAGIAAGEDLAVRYTDGSGQIVGECETTGFLDQTTNQVRFIYPSSQRTAPLTDITPVANAALVLSLLAGDITTGDTPLRIAVLYRLLNATLSYIDTTFTTP